MHCTLISDGFPAQLFWSFFGGLAERFFNFTYQVPQWSAVGNQNPSCYNPMEYILVGDLLGMFIVHLLKKKIPVRKGGSITPLRIMTRFDGHCSLLGESNISKLVVGEPGQICNIGFWSSCACISVMWKSVSKATVTWVRWGNPLILGNLRTKSLSWTFRPFWNARIPRKLFEPYLWDPWDPPLPGGKIS